MNNELKRLTPDEALAKVNEEIMGHLKIFIGYAPGVGKTYSMLNEANRMLKRNQDYAITIAPGKTIIDSISMRFVKGVGFSNG